MKSLISQARQIKASVQQADIDLGTDNTDRNTLATGTTYLEEDLNFIRSMILDITGETLWTDLPAVTLADAAGTATKLILEPVQYSGDAAGANNVVTDLDAVPGVSNTTTTTDLGYVVDDADTPSVGTKAYVQLRDTVTNMPIIDADENQIFGVAYNDGNDKVQIKFFIDDNGVYTPANVPSTFEALLPRRTTLALADEGFALVNAGFADAVGSIEVGDRNYTDVVDANGDPIYGFITDENLTSAINKLATVDGADKNLTDHISLVSGILSDTFETTFLTDNPDSYLADGDSLYTAITKLDTQAKVNELAAADASAIKVAEILIENIAEDDIHTIPQSKTYQYTDKDAMDVYLNGQLLISDAIADANNSGDTGDYAETSATEVTFHLPLEIGDVITYSIYKE